MPEKSDILTFDNFGPVTVITEDLIVYQGDIEFCGPRKEGFGQPVVAISGELEVEVEPRFLTLALACTPILLVPSGAVILTVPLTSIFPSLGTVRINVPQIISISPFNGTCITT